MPLSEYTLKSTVLASTKAAMEKENLVLTAFMKEMNVKIASAVNDRGILLRQLEQTQAETGKDGKEKKVAKKDVEGSDKVPTPKKRKVAGDPTAPKKRTTLLSSHSLSSHLFINLNLTDFSLS